MGGAVGRLLGAACVLWLHRLDARLAACCREIPSKPCVCCSRRCIRALQEGKSSLLQSTIPATPLLGNHSMMLSYNAAGLGHMDADSAGPWSRTLWRCCLLDAELGPGTHLQAPPFGRLPALLRPLNLLLPHCTLVQTLQATPSRHHSGCCWGHPGGDVVEQGRLVPHTLLRGPPRRAGPWLSSLLLQAVSTRGHNMKSEEEGRGPVA